jgi:hypothetical protein
MVNTYVYKQFTSTRSSRLWVQIVRDAREVLA